MLSLEDVHSPHLSAYLKCDELGINQNQEIKKTNLAMILKPFSYF
jgi:hypothetical protein